MRFNSPVIGLSPMDGVTDAAFRFITKSVGNPDIMYTEFVSAEGLMHGAYSLMKDLYFHKTERPLFAQIFGSDPKSFRSVSTLLCFLGFDGIDINMGCPAKSVAMKGGGAALISNPKLAQKLISTVKQGVADWTNGVNIQDLPFTEDIKKLTVEQHQSLPKKYKIKRNIPVSVKTRICFHSQNTINWISALLEAKPLIITIHGRTYKQMYAGSANWDEIAKAAELSRTRSNFSNVRTRIFGNGDVTSKEQSLQYCKEYDLDGVLIGQASMGNPWVFLDQQAVPWEERVRVSVQHCRYYEKIFPNKSFLPMRKHLGWYVRNIPSASLLRQQLYTANSSAEVEHIFKVWNQDHIFL